MGRLAGIAAGIISIAAGIYLLQTSSPGVSSWFEVIGHGLGAYFIAKGIFITRSGLLQARIAEGIEHLAAYESRDHDDQTDQAGVSHYS